MGLYQNILVHIDTDLGIQPALKAAISLGQDEKTRLRLAATIGEIPWIVNSIWPNQAEAFLSETVEQKELRLKQIQELHELEGLSLNAMVLQGTPYLELIRLAIKQKSDLLVKDQISAGEAEIRPIDATNMRLLRKCPCPIWLNRSIDFKPPVCIMAAVDVQDESSEAKSLNSKILHHAATLAQHFSARLLVVQVWELFAEMYILEHFGEEELAQRKQTYLERLNRNLDELLHTAGKGNIEAALNLIQGDPIVALPHAVVEMGADLLVMGTVARTGIAGHIIGNTAESVLDAVQCSLLVLKPEGFISPVKND